MGKEIPEVDNDDYIRGLVEEFLEEWEDEICSASREEIVEALSFHLKGMRDNVFDIFEKYI